jgi:acyl-CoA thioesterase-1
MGATDISTMLRIYLFLVLSAAAGLTHAAATLLVFGDSISAGYGLPRNQGWVDLLRVRLAREHADYKVINASLTGETTVGGKTRLGATLTQYQPQIVIIELGGNDGLRGTRIDTIRANLTTMIAECRKHDSHVLLVGMHVPPNYGSDYEEKFRLVFSVLAKTQRVPLVPFLFEGFAADRSLFQADGIHPAAAAQEKMLDNVWPQLRPLLAQLKLTGKSR